MLDMFSAAMGIHRPRRREVVLGLHTAAAATSRAAAAGHRRAPAGVRGAGARRARPVVRVRLRRGGAGVQPHPGVRVRLRPPRAHTPQPRCVASAVDSTASERVPTSRRFLQRVTRLGRSASIFYPRHPSVTSCVAHIVQYNIVLWVSLGAILQRFYI